MRLLLIFLLLVGRIQFLVSFLTCVAIHQPWIACVVAFCLTVNLTLYLSFYPETFRFGTANLRIQDRSPPLGGHSLLASCIENLVEANPDVNLPLNH